jgi:ApaG protein
MISIHTTNNVRVSVEPKYNKDFSSSDDYLFDYKITIDNNNPFPIKLIGRNLTIFDSNTDKRSVLSNVVAGSQPAIPPYKSYEYVSSVCLHSDIGAIQGNLVAEFDAGILFDIQLPFIELYSPEKLN